MKRRWSTIDAAPGYFISSHGDVARNKNGKLVRVSLFPASGAMSFKAYIDGRRTTLTVSRCVAKAFIPNPKGFHFTQHLNGDKKDNRVENIFWARHPYWG